MSNIRIDNPKRLLALAEQMNGFQNAFEKFIENIRNAVKTTMDQLMRMKISLQGQIDSIQNEITTLYADRSNYSWPEDREAIIDIDIEIKVLKEQKFAYIKQKERIDQLYKNINYQYTQSNGVRDYEKRLLKYLQGYPKGIDALFAMENIMNQYLQYSSDVVKSSIKGTEYGKFVPNKECIQSSNFSLYEEIQSKESSEYLNRIKYGRQKNYKPLTDQILSNAEFEAQKKKAKLLEFEIGDKDIELCQKSGYKVFEKTPTGLKPYTPNKGIYNALVSFPKYVAIKDLYNEIDLTGGFFKGGALYKSSQEYELDN